MEELCDYCKEDMGAIKLSTKHCVCSGCFSRIAQKNSKL